MPKWKLTKIILIMLMGLFVLVVVYVAKGHSPSLNTLGIFLQVIFLISCATLLHLAFLWMKECSCPCLIKDKSTYNIVKKFQMDNLWIVVANVIAGITTLALLIYRGSNVDASIFVGIFITTLHMFLRQPNKIEVSTALENNDINIGCGAAQAYFHGYLKVLMSHRESPLEKRLRQYQVTQGVQIFSKLIILLPKSCKTYALLTDVKCTPNIFWAGELIPLEIHICGNNRSYKNTVYVINEEIWFVAEYAPPVNTFYQMSYIGTKYNLTLDMRREQYVLFRHTLQNLIDNDLDCVDKCLLLFYNDEDDVSLSELISLSIEDDVLRRARAAG